MAEGASSRLTVAVLTLPNVRWEVAANLERLRRWVARAAASGADLVVTPEAYLDGYCLDDYIETPPDEAARARYLTIAQQWPSSPPLAEVAAIARDCRVHLVCGGIERQGTALFNAAFFFAPHGPIGRYHKAHVGWERVVHTPGDSLPVWDTPWGKVGILICFDRQFPEAMRTLAVQGAALVIVPSNGMYRGINDHMLMTRAYESTAYLAFAHPMDGLVISPRGRVLAANEEAGREEIVLRQIDLAHAMGIRARYESLMSEWRPDLYARPLP
jgi:predicted amidohydrolase